VSQPVVVEKAMPRVLQILHSRCTDAARDHEFNRWYTHTHLPDLSAAPGFISARRFSNAIPSPQAAPYMAIYELDVLDAQHALLHLTQLALAAFDAGRHIDCIEGIAAGNSPMGGQWEEIDPTSLEPLRDGELAYPPAPPQIRKAMVEMIGQLTQATVESGLDSA
jgi:hypothetical protein